MVLISLKTFPWDFLSLKKSMTCSRWYEVEQAFEKMQRRVHEGGIKKRWPLLSSWALPINIHSLYVRLGFRCISFIIWDQKEEMTRKLYIDGGKNYDVENKAGVLYNDTVQQFGKGM